MHLKDGFFIKTAVNVMEILPLSDLNASDIMELLNGLRKQARKKGLDFDDSSAMIDEDYYRLTGLAKKQFDYVVDLVKEKILKIVHRENVLHYF